MSLEESLLTIERFYSSCCDGNWEHVAGITIESTDNPGWQLTFAGHAIPNSVLADVVGLLLTEYDAQVVSDGKSVRVFAPKLANCIEASAVVLRTKRGHENETETGPIS